MRFLGLFLLLTFFSDSAQGTAKLDELVARCYTCHKEDGRSFVDEVVTLTGQNQQYLINQLYRFKTGERQERLLHVMNQVAAKLSEEEMALIANYYSQKDPKDNRLAYGPLSKKEKELYELGEQYSSVCMACHAEAEVRPATRSDWPYISGQNQPALVIQLQAFALGKRNNPMMRFMQGPPFNDPAVIEGLALYFSRQNSPSPQ